MNRNILIAIGVGIVILAVGSLFIANQQNKTSNEAMTQKDENKMIDASSDKTMEEKNSVEKDTLMDKSSDIKYIEYSKSNLERTIDKRRLLFFYASWCPTCRPADENIKSNADKIPDDLVVIRVNYNDPDTEQAEKDLARKYNITYQHTFVQIDENGNEVTKWNGGQIEDILKNI